VRSLVFAALIGLAASGCATLPTGPNVMVLPGGGKTLAQFEADDATCRQWASRRIGVTPNEAAAKTTAGGAVIGTVLGSAGGAAVGAASGSPGMGAAVGSGVGLLGGSAIGAGFGEREQGSVQNRYDVAYVQCMYASGDQIPVPRGSVPAGGRGEAPREDEPPAIPPPPAGKPPVPPPGAVR
jgi:phage tail tape-measure protein